MRDPRRPKVFCPAPGEIYFFIRADLDGQFDSRFFDSANAEDRNNFFLGNCFETAGEVKAAIAHLQVRALLRYYSSKDPGWSSPPRLGSDACQLFWSENIGTKKEAGFSSEFMPYSFREGVFFPSPEAARNAVDQIGADRVKRYLGVKI